MGRGDTFVGDRRGIFWGGMVVGAGGGTDQAHPGESGQLGPGLLGKQCIVTVMSRDHVEQDVQHQTVPLDVEGRGRWGGGEEEEGRRKRRNVKPFLELKTAPER